MQRFEAMDGLKPENSSNDRKKRPVSARWEVNRSENVPSSLTGHASSHNTLSVAPPLASSSTPALEKQTNGAGTSLNPGQDEQVPASRSFLLPTDPGASYQSPDTPSQLKTISRTSLLIPSSTSFGKSKAFGSSPDLPGVASFDDTTIGHNYKPPPGIRLAPIGASSTGNLAATGNAIPDGHSSLADILLHHQPPSHHMPIGDGIRRNPLPPISSPPGKYRPSSTTSTPTKKPLASPPAQLSASLGNLTLLSTNHPESPDDHFDHASLWQGITDAEGSSEPRKHPPEVDTRTSHPDSTPGSTAGNLSGPNASDTTSVDSDSAFETDPPRTSAVSEAPSHGGWGTIPKLIRPWMTAAGAVRLLRPVQTSELRIALLQAGRQHPRVRHNATTSTASGADDIPDGVPATATSKSADNTSAHSEPSKAKPEFPELDLYLPERKLGVFVGTWNMMGEKVSGCRICLHHGS